MCRQREKSAGMSSPSSSSGKSSGKRSVEAQTSAIVVDRSVIDDLIALVETRIAESVASVVI